LEYQGWKYKAYKININTYFYIILIFLCLCVFEVSIAPAQTIYSESVIPYDFDGSHCTILFHIKNSSAYVICFIFKTGEFIIPPWGETLLRDPEYRFTAAVDTLVFLGESLSVHPGDHAMLWNGTTNSGLPVETVPHRFYLFAFSAEPDSSLYQDRKACINRSASWFTGLITYPGWYVKYQPVHFTEIHENDVSKAVIIFDKSDFLTLKPPLSIGDEIGVFTQENRCAGSVVFDWANPVNPNLWLTVFGDDPKTPEKDGFHEGEPISLRIWDYQKNIEYNAICHLSNGTPFYTENGEYEVISLEVGDALSVSNKNILHTFSLEENFPNPFNASTMIPFILGRPSLVKLTVYDNNGRIISTLLDSKLSAGKHIIEFDGKQLASGIYFYRLESNGFTKNNKMLLIK